MKFQTSSPTPFAPPGSRWTGDPGATPGEPAYQLDANAEGEGKAALIEVDTLKGAFWRAVTDKGRLLGRSDSLFDAAQMAESYVDRVARAGAKTRSR